MANFFDKNSMVSVMKGIENKNKKIFAKKDDLDNYLPRPEEISFTIPAENWILDNEKYYAEINIDGLTENDTAEIDFDSASGSVVADAKILSEGETLSGKIRIYSKNIPENLIEGTAKVTKGLQKG